MNVQRVLHFHNYLFLALIESPFETPRRLITHPLRMRLDRNLIDAWRLWAACCHSAINQPSYNHRTHPPATITHQPYHHECPSVFMGRVDEKYKKIFMKNVNAKNEIYEIEFNYTICRPFQLCAHIRNSLADAYLYENALAQHISSRHSDLNSAQNELSFMLQKHSCAPVHV